MIKNNKFFLSVLLFTSIVHAFAQQNIQKNYIIVTFEDNYKISNHHGASYFWIIPEDSILLISKNLSYLFLNNYSKSDLTDCCSGKDIDPLVSFQNNSYKPFDSIYYNSIDTLEKIINKRRTHLQTITKNWQSGQRETISIFATPVSGIFCGSNFHFLGQEKYGYKGRVYIPYSSFKYNDQFWKSSKAIKISHEDFSKVMFDIISY